MPPAPPEEAADDLTDEASGDAAEPPGGGEEAAPPAEASGGAAGAEPSPQHHRSEEAEATEDHRSEDASHHGHSEISTPHHGHSDAPYGMEPSPTPREHGEHSYFSSLFGHHAETPPGQEQMADGSHHQHGSLSSRLFPPRASSAGHTPAHHHHHHHDHHHHGDHHHRHDTHVTNVRMGPAVVELPDASVRGLRALLKFVYTDRLDFDDKDVVEVMRLAHRYDITAVYVHCRSHVQRNIGVDNCIDWLVQADEYDIPELKRVALYMAARHLQSNRVQKEAKHTMQPLLDKPWLMNEVLSHFAGVPAPPRSVRSQSSFQSGKSGRPPNH